MSGTLSPTDWVSLTLHEAEWIATGIAVDMRTVRAGTCSESDVCLSEAGCVEDPLCHKCRTPLDGARKNWRVRMSNGQTILFELCPACADAIRPVVKGGAR